MFMSGNVYEWNMGWYDSTYPASPVTDPLGADTGLYRVLRGGSWPVYAPFCRAANRSNGKPTRRGNGIGFRLSRTE